MAARGADVLRTPTRSCAHMEIRLGIERPTSASDTGRGKCGQNRRQRRNVRMAHGSKHCSAEAIRSYISPNGSQWQALRCRGHTLTVSANGPQWQALRCRGRSRICLQDRNDGGHARKPSRAIVASCGFYPGLPPRVRLPRFASTCNDGLQLHSIFWHYRLVHAVLLMRPHHEQAEFRTHPQQAAMRRVMKK